MKITNLDKGKDYQLRPDTRIEIERTNPFFNDYAEQSVPLEIPASDHNCQLLGHPETFGLNQKQTAQRVSIQDGQFCAQSRQYVLSAQRRGNISTSFYLNDGSFYSQLQNIRLRDIFAGDVIEFDGATTSEKVQAGIAYCRRLRSGTDPVLTIFPVLLTDDSGQSMGYDYKWLNAFGKEYELGGSTAFNPDDRGTDCDFYNAVARTEYVGGKAVSLSPGYYISPFVRAYYVLERVFSYFGYTLQENFFGTTQPFSSMVLLNSVIDPLVNGVLRLQDLLPDCTVYDFLAVWRRKFCCEFVVDEGAMTASVAFFRDVVDNPPVADLTDRLTAEPVIQYKADKAFQRVVLASKERVPADTSGESYDNLKSLMQATDLFQLDARDGRFYKMREISSGGHFAGARIKYTPVSEVAMPYNTGDSQEELKIEIPDMIPELRDVNLSYTYTTRGGQTINGLRLLYGKWLYVGNMTTRGSKIQSAGSDEDQVEDQVQPTPVIMAFTFLTDDGRPAGTISPYNMQLADSSKQFDNQRTPVAGEKIFDYALYYYGTMGIFERFWRHCDTYHRNALQEVRMELLLTQSQKQQLPSTARVTIRGASFFLNKLKFSLGGENKPTESEFLSTALTEPLRKAVRFTAFGFGETPDTTSL